MRHRCWEGMSEEAKEEPRPFPSSSSSHLCVHAYMGFSNVFQQLEDARQLHRCVEKEFRHRDEEMAQAVQKQQELLERLREESAAKDGLALELHTAEGEWCVVGRG